MGNSTRTSKVSRELRQKEESFSPLDRGTFYDEKNPGRQDTGKRKKGEVNFLASEKWLKESHEPYQ